MTPSERFNKNLPLAYHIKGKRKNSPRYDDDYKQAALIGLWRACQSFDESRGISFSTYACRVIWTNLRDEDRRWCQFAAADKRQIIDDENSVFVMDGFDEVLYQQNTEDYSETETLDTLDWLLKSLPEPSRTFMDFFWLKGKTQKTIAEETGWNQCTVRKYLKDAYEQLTKIVQEEEMGDRISQHSVDTISKVKNMGQEQASEKKSEALLFAYRIADEQQKRMLLVMKPQDGYNQQRNFWYCVAEENADQYEKETGELVTPRIEYKGQWYK